MRRLLLALLGVVVAGALSFGTAQGGTYIDPTCAQDAVFYPLAERIIYGTPTGGPTPDSVECEVGGTVYEVFTGHVIQALVDFEDQPYQNGTFSPNGGDCSAVTGVSIICAEANAQYGSGFAAYTFRYTSIEGGCTYVSQSVAGGASGQVCASRLAEVSAVVGALATFLDAYKWPVTAWFKDGFLYTWANVLASGDFYSCEEWGFCWSEDDGGGDGDGDGDGGGGTDWEEGQHRTRCDGSGELNIFEKALFFAFEPCEPWAERFQETSEEALGRFPFGLATWEWFECDSEHNPGQCGWYSAPTAVTDLDGPHGRVGFTWKLPALDLGFVELPEMTFSPGESEWGVVWHNTIRHWLWWAFVAMFWASVFMRVIK